MFSTCATTCQVQAGSFDQEIGGGPQGGGRGVHLVKDGKDALIQTGKKHRMRSHLGETWVTPRRAVHGT